MASKRPILDWSDVPHAAIVLFAIVAIVLIWTTGYGPESLAGTIWATIGAAILGAGSAWNLWHEIRPRR